MPIQLNLEYSMFIFILDLNYSMEFLFCFFVINILDTEQFCHLNIDLKKNEIKKPKYYTT